MLAEVTKCDPVLGIDNSILYRPLVRGLYAGRGDKTGSSLGIDNSILYWFVVSMLVLYRPLVSGVHAVRCDKT